MNVQSVRYALREGTPTAIASTPNITADKHTQTHTYNDTICGVGTITA